jgi:ketosteroid isomerase-like protein
MRSRLHIAFAATALVSSGVLSAAPQRPHHHGAEVRLSGNARAASATVDMFHAALQRGDTKGALTLLAPDALIYEGGNAERSRSEYAAHHLGADAEFARAVRHQVTRRAGGGSGQLAWVSTEGTSEGRFRNKAVNSRTTETMLLRRTGSSWRIVHIHWSSAPAPRPNTPRN